MDDLKELAQRLDFAADCGDMGRGPDHSSVTRRSAKALRAAAARIEALEAQLAARDAEIAAWLRSGAGITPGPDGFFSHEDACVLEGLKDAADAIDARAYRSNPQ